MASFSVSGLVPISAAIAGSEVAITVESMFSMNRAVATMSGIRRSFCIGIREGTERGGPKGCITAARGGLLANPAYQLTPAWRAVSRYAIIDLIAASHYAMFEA